MYDDASFQGSSGAVGFCGVLAQTAGERRTAVRITSIVSRRTTENVIAENKASVA